ncbi:MULTISPECIES: LysR family transcriptional regulator [Actinosynnema]|uniref:LysR family transcriptional regulator n=1 Tax=Actinosynnema TaxID=40566 RepID=UPI0020A48295|nr:LysR family transcriptional regulator [Actinosynnema pretiosum]MCP2092581.1 DNA-binding transcriptional regulator, LysR family [Actinosynnema pretiosum]
MFGLERLRALHAVAAHGSVAGAAAALHVTPSGVSQQLAKLEKEAGQPLLEPRGRGVRLTTAGHVLAGHATRVLEQLARARAELDLLREDVTGTLRVGAIPTTLQALLPPALGALRERHPELAVVLREGEAEESLPRLVAGELDVAVLDSWDHLPVRVPEGVVCVELMADVADLALPAGHRLAHRRVVDLGEVDDIGWIGWSVGSGCHGWLEHVLRGEGLGGRITCAVGGYPTQLALVAGTVGAAVVPRLGRVVVPEGVRMIATRPVLGRRILAVTRAEDVERGVVRACVDVLREVADRFTQGEVGVGR